jgi:acetolactate synthase-1/2/3 large subunit
MSQPVTHPLRTTVAARLVTLFHQLGARCAWGICGREIVPIWHGLLASAGTPWAIRTFHGRHENGMGFAAAANSVLTGRPVVVYVTTGPGLTNVLTSLYSARAAGAKVILVSPVTPTAERGRLGIQETGPSGVGGDLLHRAGELFDHVTVLESSDQLPALAAQLAAGVAGPGPFLAHIAVPTSLQAIETEVVPAVPEVSRPLPGPTAALADELAELLAADPFFIWVGWGARHHAGRVRRFVEATGAPVICSPRGLGIADRSPSFFGVTGNGGHVTLPDELAKLGVQRALVLGTDLDEATSGWAPGLVPAKGFVHVDLDPSVFGRAYPQAPTLGVQADVGALLDALLARADLFPRRAVAGPIHPAAVMAAVQRLVVDGTDLPVLADPSSPMFWGARHLAFSEPNRWLTENAFGPLGFASAAVVGAAAASGAAVALCGDGAPHMQEEISTAVQYGLRARWIVLNNSGMSIVRHGMAANGRNLHDADYPPTDFAAVARAKGAEAVRVAAVSELDDAIAAALAADGPFLVDVVVDRDAVAPTDARTQR